MTAFLYKTTEEKILVAPQNGSTFSLDELQSFVGGCFQIITIPGNSEQIIIINEAGKIQNLPYNHLATTLLKDFLEPGDYIVGDALILPHHYLNWE